MATAVFPTPFVALEGDVGVSWRFRPVAGQRPPSEPDAEQLILCDGGIFPTPGWLVGWLTGPGRRKARSRPPDGPEMDCMPRSSCEE